MAINPYTRDTNVISQLHDRPITDDGLTPTLFKQKFDQAITEFKEWFNGEFIPALNSTFQKKVTVSGMVKFDGNGNVYSAVPGTDYQLPLEPNTDYQPPMTAGVDYQTPLVADENYLTPTKAAQTYEPTISEEKKRRIYYGEKTAAEFFEEQQITPQVGDIYIKLPASTQEET